VNIHDAKTHLSRLLERVEAGEEIIIARNGRPIARIVPEQRTRPPRVPGSPAGKIWMSPDFDEPDDELIDLFYNGPIFPERDETNG
jgi:prevent-host-death family protein